MERAPTFLTTGTTSPPGVSIAMPMLWMLRISNWGFCGFEVVSSFALRMGYLYKASDTALMTNGRKDNFGEVPVSFSDLRTAASCVTLMVSEYKKCGMESEVVMVWNILL